MSPEHGPPTKASLLKWWSQFTNAQKTKKEYNKAPAHDEHPVFGRPLKESLKRASVQISTANADGDLYVWGYIPVVVAKWYRTVHFCPSPLPSFLLIISPATEVEGTFRVNGSAKRMRDLQAAFENPPRFGKDLDWKKEHYTTHDVASVFRRYLTQMPEPVIPHHMYHDVTKKPYNKEEVTATYKQLIQRMPRANQYLLLYVLDLLSVFARKSDKNLMTAANLAVIFRPGLISHPDHELSPSEHKLSQEVLEFLIAHQDCHTHPWHPPRPSRFSTSPQDDEDPDLVVVPSSDDEPSNADGWRLAGQRRRITRRRTTHEHVDSQDRAVSPTPQELSPVAERPSSTTSSILGVVRSRTLPSRRDRGGTDEEFNNLDDDGRRARVLRKQRRLSVQPKKEGTE
ncbi:Rho GTPase activation protein [Pisolithus marmoratus]|nr:Rho GTPase activation protein [Pisolithus marmoratus]